MEILNNIWTQLSFPIGMSVFNNTGTVYLSPSQPIGEEFDENNVDTTKYISLSSTSPIYLSAITSYWCYWTPASFMYNKDGEFTATIISDSNITF